MNFGFNYPEWDLYEIQRPSRADKILSKNQRFSRSEWNLSEILQLSRPD